MKPLDPAPPRRRFITQRRALLLVLITAALNTAYRVQAAIPAQPPASYFEPAVPVGSINVSAGVSAQGTATAAIPIAVPPGRLGMQPELSLSYASGGGGGMLGVGFTLNGIPFIERCEIDTVHPDRFVEGMVDICLGGDRLILVSGEHLKAGARYRVRGTPSTLVEFGTLPDGNVPDPCPGNTQGGCGIDPVPPSDNSAHWIVRYGDGRWAQFGGYADTVYAGRWYISRLSDAYENRVVYEYSAEKDIATNSTIALLPKRIRYTLTYRDDPNHPGIAFDSGTRQVHFQYALLAAGESYDIHTRHGSHHIGKRLKTIKSEVLEGGGWVEASSYELTYRNDTTSARSLLSTVTRCDRNDVCLPPVTLAWNDGNYTYNVRNLDNAAAAAAPARDDMQYAVSADFDRDGRDEIAYVSDLETSWRIWDPDEGAITTSAPARVILDRPETAFSGKNAALAPQVADFNGDGLPDIVSPYCDSPDGRDCFDQTVRDLDYIPYADALAFNMAAGAPMYLHTGTQGAGTVPHLNTADFRGNNNRIFINQVAEIDGDGHPDLYICAGENSAKGWWHLALNRMHDNNPQSDFQIVPTWRRCFAWDIYQVFDSNSNGLDELHVPFRPEGTYRHDAALAKGALPWQPGTGLYGSYWALEFPRYTETGTPIPVNEAIAMLSPPSASSPHLTPPHDPGEIPPRSGWSFKHQWQSLPLDYGTRILNSCMSPAERDAILDAPDEDVEDLRKRVDELAHLLSQDMNASRRLRLEDKLREAAARLEELVDSRYGDGLVELDEVVSSLEPDGQLFSSHLVPFVTPGPSSDIKVDLNGDGLVDVIRLIAVVPGQLVADSQTDPDLRDGNAVYRSSQVGTQMAPPQCKTEDDFDFVYAYYLNRGGSLEFAGSSPRVLQNVQPWVAARVLRNTIFADINGDGRPDITVPDYAAFLADAHNISSWKSYIQLPEIGKHLTVSEVFDVPYLLDADPAATGRLPADPEGPGERFFGPIWLDDPNMVSLAAQNYPSVLGLMGIADTARESRRQVISGSLHLNDQLNSDVVVFSPSDSLRMRAITFEKASAVPLDYLKRITDGLGEVKGEFTYSHSRVLNGPTSGPNNEPGTLAKSAPQRVVTRFAQDAGVGTKSLRRWTDFEYRDGRADRLGGFLGFERIIRRHYAGGIAVTEPYAWDREIHGRYTEFDPAKKAYPYGGATEIQSERRAPGVRLIARNLLTYGLVNTDHPGILATYLDTNTKETFEKTTCLQDPEFCAAGDLTVNSRLTRDFSDVTAIDAFGNILSVQAQSLDNSSSTTTRVISNSTAPGSLWRIGLLDSEAVSHTGPDTSVRNTSTSYTWNATTGATETITRQPGGDADTYLHQVLERDNRGNVVASYSADLASMQAKPPAATVASIVNQTGVRAKYTKYDPLGYFPIESRNEAGWGEDTLFEPFFGNVIARKGPDTQAHARTSIDGLGRETRQRTTMGMLGAGIGEEFTTQLIAETAYNGAYARVLKRNGQTIERQIYDRSARLTAREYPVLNQVGPDPTTTWYKVITVFDPLGRVASETVPLPLAQAAISPLDLTEYRYDQAGRKSEVIRSGGLGTVRYTHDKLQTSVTDAENKVSRARVSAAGQVVYTRDGNGTGTCYFYGAFSQLRRVSRNCQDADADNQGFQGTFDTVLTYDSIGRRVGTITPESGGSTVAYNGFDQPRRTTEALGQQQLLQYDVLGRLSTRTGPDHTASYTYDVGLNALGRLQQTQIVYPANGPTPAVTVRKSFQFDNWGRTQSEVLEVPGMGFGTLQQTYSYTADNLLDQAHALTPWAVEAGNNSLSVRYGYNSLGMQQVVGDLGDADRYFRERRQDGWGMAVEGEYGDGALRTVTTQARTGRVSRVRTVAAGPAFTPILDWSYLWSADGDLLERTDSIGLTKTECFQYDAAHQMLSQSRLVSGTCGKGVTNAVVNLSYDAYGRTTFKSDVPGAVGPQSFTFDGVSGRPFTAGALTYSFDTKGQLTQRWGSTAWASNTSMKWHSFGKLKEMTGAGQSVNLYYDADGTQALRLESDGRKTLYLGAQTRTISPANVVEHRVAISSASGNIAEVSLTAPVAPAVLATRKLTFLHTDQQGSPTALVQGGVISQRRFNAWGRRADLPNVPGVGVLKDSVTVGFTGHEAETGFDLVNMRARYFDSVLGQFVQADSLIPNPLRGSDWNRYAYVRNNPYRYIDPTGHNSVPSNGGGGGSTSSQPSSPTAGERSACASSLGSIGGDIRGCYSGWDSVSYDAEYQSPTPGIENYRNTGRSGGGGGSNSGTGQSGGSPDYAPISEGNRLVAASEANRKRSRASGEYAQFAGPPTATDVGEDGLATCGSEDTACEEYNENVAGQSKKDAEIEAQKERANEAEVKLAVAEYEGTAKDHELAYVKGKLLEEKTKNSPIFKVLGGWKAEEELAAKACFCIDFDEGPVQIQLGFEIELKRSTELDESGRPREPGWSFAIAPKAEVSGEVKGVDVSAEYKRPVTYE